MRCFKTNENWPQKAENQIRSYYRYNNMVYRYFFYLDYVPNSIMWLDYFFFRLYSSENSRNQNTKKNSLAHSCPQCPVALIPQLSRGLVGGYQLMAVKMAVPERKDRSNQPSSKNCLLALL